MKAPKQPAVYIITNQRNGTLYTGVTANLIQRIAQHAAGTIPGFAATHNCKYLVWYELHETMPSAIAREKQLKAGPRIQKLRQIESQNLPSATSTQTSSYLQTGSNRHCERAKRQRSNPEPNRAIPTQAAKT